MPRAKRTAGEVKATLKTALEAIETQGDEHLYHSTGWAREIALASLGLPAVLPPPEEKRDVQTAMGAARQGRSGEDAPRRAAGRAAASGSGGGSLRPARRRAGLR